jgi:DNA-binding transcriptional ArsR family regulator
MSTTLSVAEILAKLEARIALHRQQADFHAQQEIHHREQSAFHLAELEKVTQHFEAFKATALPAADLAREPTAPPPVEEAEDDPELAGKRIEVSKLVARAVDRLEDETFGATRVAEEVNRRYRNKLRKPVDARAVSITLRRLRDAGHLRLVREGKAAHEALYAKASRQA